MKIHFISFLRLPVWLSRQFWWKNSLNSSENEIVRFQGFVLIVFWDSISYTVRIVFWMISMESVNALARRWPCACLNWVSGFCRLEKTWTFSDAYMSLTWCSKFVQTWMKKLLTAFLLLHCVDGCSCLDSQNDFFNLDFRF